MVMKKKTTQGRKKIEIKKIETNRREVTFSKRRGGLFKKASELCVLTGAEIAIMVNSRSGRVYSFGHPSPDHVLDRYLASTGTLGSKQAAQFAYPHNPISEFNQLYAKLSKELEEEKKKKDVIDQSKLVNNGELWWGDEPIDGLPLDELEQYVSSMEELKTKVVTRVEELMMITGSKSLFDMNQTTNNQGLVEFGNYQKNMEYGTNFLVPFGMDFGHGNI